MINDLIQKVTSSFIEKSLDGEEILLTSIFFDKDDWSSIDMRHNLDTTQFIERVRILAAQQEPEAIMFVSEVRYLDKNADSDLTNVKEELKSKSFDTLLFSTFFKDNIQEDRIIMYNLKTMKVVLEKNGGIDGILSDPFKVYNLIKQAKEKQ